MGFKITQDNTKAIKTALEQQVDAALEEIGEVCEGYAKNMAPVRTGRLKSSITHQRAAGFLAQRHTVYIGTNVEYATYQEFGTSKIKPQPFLKPAIVDHVDEYQGIVRNRLK